MVDKQKIGTFVLGGIAGALAGILLAPKSGKELRGSIANRAGEARERTPSGEEDRPVRAVGDLLPKLDTSGTEPLIEA
ncbi:MAG TPA: YtxH domain-containing protein, partial [Rubrobacteraceae bacterium]|nr:YtxH domain-containing protein [Rubrobacteraceae bacterium]